MYQAFTALLLLVFIMVTSANDPRSIEKKVVYNAKHYVKKVFTSDGGHCSSTFVKYKNKVRYLTNAHCCKTDLSLDGSPVSFIKIDIQNDLCELSSSNMLKDGLNLSSTDIQITDIVYTVGFPANYDLTLDKGRVAAINYISTVNNQVLVATTAFSFGGSSGGAALNEYGNLIGIVSQANGLGKGYFIPLKTIRDFLN